ncbi:hypothetical protein R1sor_018793 [Riccia sorocarpa]|uniref:Uncharacterized protein n=1 Tax=Riccia sorocarpa TaxID=122646 RepID=A0ABD3IBT1_9MARC
MRGIGDPRAVAALRRGGGTFYQKCFSRNSVSTPPGGRGRGAVAGGVPSRGPIGAPASDNDGGNTSSIGGDAVQVIDVSQSTNELATDDGVLEWREAIHRRISLTDVQNRSGYSGAAGRGRGIGAPSSATQEEAPQFDSPSGAARGRGFPIPLQNAGRGRVSTVPGPVGAAGRGSSQSSVGGSFTEKNLLETGGDFSQSPGDSSSTGERLLREFTADAEGANEANAAPSEVESLLQGPSRKFFSPQITLPSFGRGRGQVDEVPQEVTRAGAVRPKQSGRERMKAPGPKSPQLSAEEARARAIAILAEGIEKNVAAEGERRRKAGMDKFADATEFYADRFKREPAQGPSQTQGTRREKERQRRTSRPRSPRTSGEMTAAEPSVETRLTPEQEAELVRLDNENTFKENLHRLFLVQFEPEYAMEEFGRNPDIDEPPVLSLEEYLQSLKPMFLRDSAELSEEQQWEEAVQRSLANAPQLEKLVEAYAGRGRMTARQEIQKLEALSDKLPQSVPPEVSAFTQRALITIQNNPGLTFQQKERLMSNMISGFSSL